MLRMSNSSQVLHLKKAPIKEHRNIARIEVIKELALSFKESSNKGASKRRFLHCVALVILI